MSALHLQLITPERTLLDEEVASISCTTSLGQITILPGHVPLVTALVPDELIVKTKAGERSLHVGGGIVQVQPGSRVVVLADAAEHVAEIDAARAREAAAKAKERLAEGQMGDREYAAVAALLERNLARMRIVRKHAHRRTTITGEGVLEE